jgi:filamentous hemagglutinin family protein
MATRLSKLLIAVPTMVVFSVIGAGSPAAQVTLDGTANRNFTGRAPFDNGNYDLRAELGRRAGPNLFHSFRRFSLRNGERATFSGPGEIERIISRVTGGERSDIDGTIASTIPGADFYFLNPAGVVFGPNASLDLQGSFHVSTADELRFADGAKFSAANPVASSFTVAAPEAFGFLGQNPAPIRVDQSVLEVPVGKSLSIAGGDIDISESFIRAEVGQVTLAAVGGPGEARPASGAINAVRKADISLTNQALVDTSGDGGGLVVVAAQIVDIRAGSAISSSTFAGSNAGQVTIAAQHIQIHSGGRINSSSSGDGQGGSIRLSASDFSIRNGVISSDTFGGGDAGTIEIQTGSIEIVDGGGISSSARGPGGAAGDVIIAADRIIVERTSIMASSTSEGGGGIRIIGGDLINLRESEVNTSVAGGINSTAGNILIDPRILILDGSRILANAPMGFGGDITLVAQNLFISFDSLLSTTGTTSISDDFKLILANNLIIGGLIVPDKPNLNVSNLLRARCGARRDIGASSFTGVGRGGLPPSPEGPLASAYIVEEALVAEAHAAKVQAGHRGAPSDVRLAGLPRPCAPLD